MPHRRARRFGVRRSDPRGREGGEERPHGGGSERLPDGIPGMPRHRGGPEEGEKGGGMAAMRVVVVVVVVGRRDDRSGHGREHGLPGGDELRHSRSRDNPRDRGAVPAEQTGIGTAFPLHRELRGLLGVGHNAVREFDSVSLLLRFTTYEIRIPGVRSVCDIPVDRGELHPLPRDRVAPQAVPVGTAIAVYMGMRIIGNSGRGVLPYVGIQGQILIGDVFRNGMDMHILPSGSARGAPDERGGPARRGGGRVHRRRVSFRRARMHAPISSAPFPSFDRFSLSYVPGSRFFLFSTHAIVFFVCPPGSPFFIRDTNLDHSIWHVFVLAGEPLIGIRYIDFDVRVFPRISMVPSLRVILVFPAFFRYTLTGSIFHWLCVYWYVAKPKSLHDP